MWEERGISFLQIWDLWGGRLGQAWVDKEFRLSDDIFFLMQNPVTNIYTITCPHIHIHSLCVETLVTKLYWEWPLHGWQLELAGVGGSYPGISHSQRIFCLSGESLCRHCQWRNVAQRTPWKCWKWRDIMDGQMSPMKWHHSLQRWIQ